MGILLLDVPFAKNNKFLKDFLKNRFYNDVDDYCLDFRRKPFIHKKDKNKYRVHHRIICPRKYCKPPKEIAPNLLKVSYCAVENL